MKPIPQTKLDSFPKFARCFSALAALSLLLGCATPVKTDFKSSFAKDLKSIQARIAMFTGIGHLLKLVILVLMVFAAR